MNGSQLAATPFLEFDFYVVRLAGGEHKVANTLSRLRTDGTDTTTQEADLPVMDIGVVSRDKNGFLSHSVEQISRTSRHLNSDQKNSKRLL